MSGNLEKLARENYVGTDPNVIETMKLRLKPIPYSRPAFSPEVKHQLFE